MSLVLHLLSLDKYRKLMKENKWEVGEDDEELFEYAMHPAQYEASTCTVNVFGFASSSGDLSFSARRFATSSKKSSFARKSAGQLSGFSRQVPQVDERK